MGMSGAFLYVYVLVFAPDCGARHVQPRPKTPNLQKLWSLSKLGSLSRSCLEPPAFHITLAFPDTGIPGGGCVTSSRLSKQTSRGIVALIGRDYSESESTKDHHRRSPLFSVANVPTRESQKEWQSLAIFHSKIARIFGIRTCWGKKSLPFLPLRQKVAIAITEKPRDLLYSASQNTMTYAACC